MLGAVTLIAALRFFGFVGSQAVEIKDVTKPEIVVLRSFKPVSGISVRINGSLDGTATIERAYTNERRMYGPQQLGPGTVSFKTGGDWYSEKCIIYYEPGSVRSGHLTIEYKFHL